MAKDALIQARIERGLKEEVDKILNALGLSASEVINALYAQIRLTKGLPFIIGLPDNKLAELILDNGDFSVKHEDVLKEYGLENPVGKASVPESDEAQ